jgi:hypothetical protein
MEYKIQNANYIERMKCKISKFSELYLVLCKMQNLLPYDLLRLFWVFFFPLEAEIQNGE